MYKPTRVQARYRDLLFSRMSQDAIPAELGIEQRDIDGFYEDPDFSEWLLDGIEKLKAQFAVPIIVQMCEDAREKKAPFQLRELVLRVLKVYMPTSKTVREQDADEQKKDLDRIKKQAKKLKKVAEGQNN
jgi:hypothetical protein